MTESKAIKVGMTEAGGAQAFEKTATYIVS